MNNLWKAYYSITSGNDRYRTSHVPSGEMTYTTWYTGRAWIHEGQTNLLIKHSLVINMIKQDPQLEDLAPFNGV